MRFFSPTGMYRCLLRRIWRVERPGVQVAIHLRQPLVLAAFAVALVWYLAAPSPTTVMATVALGGMAFFGFLWVRVLGSHLHGERRLRYAALQVGEELEEEICLQNTARLPALWTEFEDHSNLPGYSISSVRGVDGHSETRWRVTTLCARRGLFALGPWAVVTGDPFGIFRLRLIFPSREEVLVYPPLAPLPRDLLPKGRAVGDQRLLHQLLPAETTNLASTRPYAPGDPLRHIHWRTTARRQSAFPDRGPAVKVFEPESYSAVWLIPDLDSAAQFGEGDEGSLEKLVILTASLAAELLGERRAVGLFALGLDGEVVVQPQGGGLAPQRGVAGGAEISLSSGLFPILRGLAGVRAAQDLPFERVLEQSARLIPRRSLVIALTPSTCAAWIQRMAPKRGVAPGALAVLLAAGQEDGHSACLEELAARGIPARLLQAAEIHPQAASYGALQRWEFTTLGTGRAYARHKPRQAGPLPGGVQ